MIRRLGRRTLPVRLARPLAALAATAVLLGGGAVAGGPGQGASVDVLILGGQVIDGSGRPSRAADLAIRDGRIVFIGDASDRRFQPGRTINAEGLVVTPGFIDPHTHSGGDLAAAETSRRMALNHLAQGVTTVLVGNDGDGRPDVAARLAAFEEAGVGVNVGTFVGLGGVRRAVLGQADRSPTVPELGVMKRLTAQAMCEGAFGFSAGLYYAPQSYAKTDEVIALAREAALRGGLYETHLRDEGSDNIGLLAAVEEALQIGRQAGLPVHFAHIKALGVDVHGQSGAVIARIEAERAAGRKVSADQYPWAASGTRVSSALMPRWAMDGGREALRQRLAAPEPRLVNDVRAAIRRRGGPESLLIVTGPLSGKTLGRVAATWNLEPELAAIRIVRDENDAGLASFNMAQSDIDAFAVRPWVVTASDATEGHPRKFGTFPLAWTSLVGRGLMSPEQFIRRSSGQTADIFGIQGRGYLKTGYAADVIIIDPTRFRALADYAQPTRLSEGVQFALVNGVLAIDHGRPTEALAGKAVRPAKPDGGCP